VNSFPPQTFFSLEAIATQNDTRWKRCVVLRAAANCLDNLLFQWTADGIDLQIGEFEVENKTGDYGNLRDNLNEKYGELIEKLKVASQNFTRVSTYNPSNMNQGYSHRILTRYYVSRLK
jgi:hypothetical protein